MYTNCDQGAGEGLKNISAPAMFLVMLLLVHGTESMQRTSAITTHAL